MNVENEKIMKISPLTIQYSYKTAKQDINKASKSSAIISNNLNSSPMSELIGRSQVVSFSASNKISGSLFEHECSEMFKEKDRIVYNKQDGSLTHQIFRRDGTLKRQEEYYPKDDTEIITRVDTDGSKTVTKKTGMAISLEKFNSDEQQIYYSIRDDIGNERQIQTDYERGRRVFYSKSPDKKPVIKVLDLTTGTYVTSGPLVADRVYDKKSDTYFTENIVTGRVLKKEKYFPNDKLEYSAEYSERTGNLLKEIKFDKKDCGYIEYTYDEFKTLKSIAKTIKNGKIRREFIFDNFGRKIISDKEYGYKKDRSLEYEITYVPDTDIIAEEKVYHDINSYTFYKYGQNPNVPLEAAKYANGILEEELSYYDDGDSIYSLRKFNPDGSYSETYYTPAGYKEMFIQFSSAKFMYKKTEYFIKSGIPAKITEFDRFSKEIREFYFDEITRLKKKSVIKDNNNIIKEIVEYYPDGQIPKKKISYNFDRSYSETLFDQDGHVKNITHFNPDGTRKVFYDRDYYSSYAQRTRTGYKTSDEDFLKHIADVTAKNGKYNISDDEWKRLASILDIDNYENLKNMDKQLYRRLALKFHPDHQHETKNQELYEELFKIINCLYHS